VGERIVIVGSSCAGKSTLGQLLGAWLGLPVVELDALYWLPGWQGCEEHVFLDKVRDAVARERWVLVGNYVQQRDLSWSRADTLIWLDLPLHVTIPRILTRSFRRWRSRELLWGTNSERFFQQLAVWDPERSLIAHNIERHQARRARYAAAMQDPEWTRATWHRLRTRREVDAWVQRHLGTSDHRTSGRVSIE
jgi:adenylate kinase family enzyme